MIALWITVCVSRAWTVWYSCINTESALRSAADVKVLLTSSIFHPVPSRPPCRNAPRCIPLWRLKGVETWAPPGHQPSDTRVNESQPQCQHHDWSMHHAAASQTPAKQCYLSAHRQLRPGNILTMDSTVTLMVNISFDCTFLTVPKSGTAHTQSSSTDTNQSYESRNMILFDWMHKVQIGFPLTPPPLPAQTSTDER